MNEEQEEILSEQESLQLITNIINKAKSEFVETGISALMWGGIVTICSLVQFAAYFYNIPWAGAVWWLTLLAVIPQIIVSIREGKQRKYKTYHDDAMNGIWLSFGITMFLFNYYINAIDVPLEKMHIATMYLIIYGIPTFSTGYARRFVPMIVGGIACWVLAIASLYIPYPYTMLCYTAAAQLAWFIPGLILQRRYLQAKRQHV